MTSRARVQRRSVRRGRRRRHTGGARGGAQQPDPRPGAGELRIWREDDALICDVHDRGRIADPMVGRRAPSWGEESGRGLWMANQLCDLVQVRSGRTGTTVRIHTWL